MTGEELRLYPYQQDDVERMVEILSHPPHVCWNLNEQRTGKLIEFIELVQTLGHNESQRVLVVAPLTTLPNVRYEFSRWADIDVRINARESDTFRVHAINKEKLRDPSHWVFRETWDLVLVDEVHHFRGRNSKQTEGLQHLRTHKLVLASGTPLMSGLPYELFPLLKRTDPTRWTSFWAYLKEYASNLIAVHGNGVSQDIRSPWKKGKRIELQEYLAPISLRRTFAEVRPELPALTKQTLNYKLADLDADHYRLYTTLERDWRLVCQNNVVEVGSKVELTGALRRLAASPCLLDDIEGEHGGKCKAIAEYVHEHPGKGIVWCWHRGMVHAVASQLWDTVYKEQGRNIYLITGEDNANTRAYKVVDFQRDGNAPILIATIASLMEGITLDTAEWAIFAEQSYNPSDNEQAAMRIMGGHQRGSPLISTVVLEDTIERHVQRILTTKQGACDAFMVIKELIEAVNGGGERGS